jgi:hypothetical protein
LLLLQLAIWRVGKEATKAHRASFSVFFSLLLISFSFSFFFFFPQFSLVVLSITLEFRMSWTFMMCPSTTGCLLCNSPNRNTVFFPSLPKTKETQSERYNFFSPFFLYVKAWLSRVLLTS